jgi:ABC-type branched-subunit amino acid transport system ATPase component
LDVSDALLDVEDLHAAYVSGVDILQGLSLAVERGSVTLVIGPNGAGKSTLLRTIFGLIKALRGRIRFAGRPIEGREPAAIKALGIGYVPQEINVFPLLTVEENLRMGGWIFRRDRARLASALDRVFTAFPALADRRRARAGALSGGQGRMLSVAREMMTAPELMLVDEPTAGLAPALVSQVYELLHAARRAGSTILLVDQNIEDAVREADYVYLVDLGRVRAHGPAREFPLARVSALIQECLLQ